jgi:glycosyltransferase involved in cell wall biosynthesis
VRVRPARAGTSRARRALTLPWVEAAELRRCAVLRVFQITGVIPAVLARARFGIPYVTTYGFWYGALSRGGPTRLLKRVLEHVGLTRADAVIVTTESLRRRAARVARRTVLIPNGVDVRRFRPPEEPPLEAGPSRRVLYVGRFSEEKNLAALVEAAALLRGRTPVRLVLVGAGPLEGRLRAEAARRGVDVEFPGVVPYDALPPLYAGADAFVLASFTEGHPKVLLEAMSAGRPCVVSDCDGNRSLVTDGVTGLTFDPHRPETLADALARALADPVLAASLGKAARDLVVERYDLGALVAREIALLAEVARTGARAAPAGP